MLLPYDEVTKAIRRREAFQANGLPEEEAMMLADQMLERDLLNAKKGAQDTRRVCFECRNFKGMFCHGFDRPTKPPMFVLQRCEKFALRGTK
jgi:hypothetical protein